MIELWALIVLLLVCIGWIWWNSHEGFAGSNVYLQACPTGFASTYQADGTTLCCEGEIMAKRCLGTRQCVLNGVASGEIMPCATLIQDDYAKKGKELCPASMGSYFEEGGKRGCTDGSLNPTLSGPKGTSQKTCWIYDTSERNATEKDSCANEKEMEGFPCFGKECTKELVSVAADKPVKIAVNFTDDTGMRRVAYTRASLQRYLDAAMPGWHDRMDLQKNIGVAEVAKAYYVDHMIAKEDVQI